MGWGYVLGVAIEVELRKMRERERVCEKMTQALLLGFWFRSLVMEVPCNEKRKTKEEGKSRGNFGI